MSSSCKVSTFQYTNDTASSMPTMITNEKEGYLTGLMRNISNQFYKDPCRSKMHEQIIGSLIF